MLRIIAAAALAVLALSTLGGSAEAKSPGWVIAGGELGSMADHFFMDFSESEMVATPAEHVDSSWVVSSSAYDLYPSYGNLGVPYQLATDGPTLRYYPDVDLIQRPSSDAWYNPSPEIVAAFDHVILLARVRKAIGHLEANPIAADLRARGLDSVSYWLKPVDRLPLGDPERYYPSASARCAGCLSLPQPSEPFVMQHLVETLRSPVQSPAGERPLYVIEYYGQVGIGGIGGLLGFYSPPEDGRPGRFWYDGYFYDQTDALSHATTPAFDDYMAQASATGAPAGATAAEEEGRGPSALRTILGGSAALAIASAMFVTLAARRLRS